MKNDDRVELAPHLDLWMQGARYGTVVKVVGHKAMVKLDKVKVPKLITLANLKKV